MRRRFVVTMLERPILFIKVVAVQRNFGTPRLPLTLEHKSNGANMPSMCYKGGIKSWTFQTTGSAHGCTTNTPVFQRAHCFAFGLPSSCQEDTASVA